MFRDVVSYNDILVSYQEVSGEDIFGWNNCIFIEGIKRDYQLNKSYGVL